MIGIRFLSIEELGGRSIMNEYLLFVNLKLFWQESELRLRIGDIPPHIVIYETANLCSGKERLHIGYSGRSNPQQSPLRKRRTVINMKNNINTYN